MHLADGTTLDYDVLVVATGSRLVPEETEGLTGPGLDGEGLHVLRPRRRRRARRRRSTAFDGGRVVVNVVDMPIKCPVAPLEFCFLADWYFHERGIRDRVELTYVTPLDGAFTKPTASAHARRDARRARHRAGHRVQHRRGRRRGRPARSATTSARSRSTSPSSSRCTAAPPTSPTPPASATPSTSCVTDPHTLQSEVAPNIFAIGDAANLPASKAGSVTHFEGEVLVENIKRFLAGEPLDASYDGHANCFIETGFHKAMLIDFNYDTEPVGGHFPTAVGAAAAEGVPPQPPRQADVPVVLLARPAARPRHPRRHVRHADRRQAPHRHVTATDHRTTREETTMPTATLDGVDVAVNDEGLLRGPRPVDRGHGRRARPRRGHRRADRPALAGHPLHARRSTSRRAPARPSACSARPRASPSRSSTSCSRRARRRWPPRSPASPSPAAASEPPADCRPVTKGAHRWATPSRRSRSSSPRAPSRASTPG